MSIKMNVGYTLQYPDGEMNLNYFHYYRNPCIKEIAHAYGKDWKDMRKQGFKIIKIQAEKIA